MFLKQEERLLERWRACTGRE